MGENKALLPFGTSDAGMGESLIAYLFKKYAEIFGEVYLCCKKGDEELYSGIGGKILCEESEVFSPMIGLQASLERLQRKIFVVSVDCPFLQRKHFLRLEDAYLEDPRSIIYAKTEKNSHFLIGIYLPHILPALNETIKKMNYKMSYFVESCDSIGVYFEDEESFENLNTPSQYQNALSRMKNG